MFRKTILALTASVALGAIALAPTSASAKGGGGHGFGHGGHGFGHGYAFGHGYRGGFGVAFLAPSVDCVTYQWVRTRRGWMQVPVDTCSY